MTRRTLKLIITLVAVVVIGSGAVFVDRRLLKVKADPPKEVLLTSQEQASVVGLLSEWNKARQKLQQAQAEFNPIDGQLKGVSDYLMRQHGLDKDHYVPTQTDNGELKFVWVPTPPVTPGATK